jgi:beta-aspartyl-peptidase (threonine type)
MISFQFNRLHYLHKALALLIVFLVIGSSYGQQENQNPSFGLVIHGGAGTILKKNMTPEREEAYRAKLTEALTAGYDILFNDGSSLDAVETAIKILEDSPLFNAGKGAVFTNDGTNELDASIMDGKTLNAGAVASIKHIKNPISLARLVMEKSPHVMLVGQGAEAFASQNGLEWVTQYDFYTERRWKQLERKKQAETEHSNSSGQEDGEKEESKADHAPQGTVGAAALDKAGNLAAGTSTGGLTNKMFGRVGDSPIIGAGTYANNQTCAVSATGDGEFFMRLLVAYDIHALMAYQGMSLQEAADTVVMEKVTQLGGKGGVIAIDKDGNMAMPFSTEGMYRGYVGADGKIVVKIYKE